MNDQKLTLPDEFPKRDLNIARLWAAADGCEGGDYIHGLLELWREADGGGYCYSENEQIHKHLLKIMVNDQVKAMKESVASGEPGPWDTSFTDEIERLEREG